MPLTYDEQTWANGPEGETPIDADRLNHVEAGIAAAAAALNAELTRAQAAEAALAGAIGGIDGGTPSSPLDVLRPRRGTFAAWTAANPELGVGEIGLEVDSGLSKTGDGSTPYNSLPYDYDISTPRLRTDSTDQTDAINAIFARAAKGLLDIRQIGDITIEGPVTVPNGWGLRLPTAGQTGSPTKLLLVGSTARLTVVGGGGDISNVYVDGQNIADIPFVRDGGTGGQGRSFRNVFAHNGVTNAMKLIKAQNDLFQQVGAQGAGRSALLIDHGAGGTEFQRLELGGGALYNLEVQNNFVEFDPYLAPSNIKFSRCIFENPLGSAESVVYINGAYDLIFDGTDFISQLGTSGPTLHVTGGAKRILVRDALFQNTNAIVTGSKAISVDFDGCDVILDGTIQFANYDICRYIDASVVSSAVSQLNARCTTSPLSQYNTLDGASGSINPASYIGRYDGEQVTITRKFISDFLRIILNPNNGFLEHADMVNGQHTYGGSGDFHGDVVTGRRAAGVFGVVTGVAQLSAAGNQDAMALATGAGTKAQRPAANAANLGMFRVNTDTNMWEYSYDGTNWYQIPFLKTLVSKNADYATTGNEFVSYDVSGASHTLTLPTTPESGTLVAARVVVTAAGHSLTIAAGGSDVFHAAGGATSIALKRGLLEGVVLRYSASAAVWSVVSWDYPPASTNPVKAQKSILMGFTPGHAYQNVWNLTDAAALPYLAISNTTSPAVNDAFGVDVEISEGTWDFSFAGYTGAGFGIATYDISFDAGTSWTALGTADYYAASGAPALGGPFTGVAVPSGVTQAIIRCRVLSKNASSSGYANSLAAINMRKTA